MFRTRHLSLLLLALGTIAPLAFASEAVEPSPALPSPVAPGIWARWDAHSVTVHLTPPLFTEESLPKFRAFVAQAEAAGASKTVLGQLRGALRSAEIEWETLQQLDPATIQELRRQTAPAAQPGQAAPQGLLNCTRATAGPTTARPGAKAYAKGSCVNATNHVYARAEAAGEVRAARDAGWNGAFASAFQYGGWACASYGAASAYLSIGGFRITVDSSTAAYDRCR